MKMAGGEGDTATTATTLFAGLRKTWKKYLKAGILLDLFYSDGKPLNLLRTIIFHA